MPQRRLKVVKGPMAGRLLWYDEEHAERELKAKRAVQIDDPAVQSFRLTNAEKEAQAALLEQEAAAEAQSEPVPVREEVKPKKLPDKKEAKS